MHGKINITLWMLYLLYSPCQHLMWLVTFALFLASSHPLEHLHNMSPYVLFCLVMPRYRS